jgi:hypothetical protein
MMYIKWFMLPVLAASLSVHADTEIDALKSEVEALQQRIEQMEETDKAEAKTSAQSQRVAGKSSRGNTFNPGISLIFNGRYADFSRDPEEYTLPGFSEGPHSGLGPQGFSIGETELSISGNADDLFYGWATLALHDEGGELELDLEEAYMETLSMPAGTRIRAGRFYSAIGYLNQQHPHAWDFYDAPLIYRGLFGNQLKNDGLQFSVVLPTDLYFELGGEAGAGNNYPAANSTKNLGTWTLYGLVGGDVGVSHSWQLGLSYWDASDINERSGGHAHDHGDGDHGVEFSGKQNIAGLNAIYKWAPNGNPRNRNFKFQFEYFDSKSDGDLADEANAEFSTLDQKQRGFYAQAIYQFRPQWAAGLRYDQVDSEASGSEPDLIDEAGLDAGGYKPKRYGAMVQWAHSEYSRIRLQYNYDKSVEEGEHEVYLQYTLSLGAHPAHQF